MTYINPNIKCQETLSKVWVYLLHRSHLKDHRKSNIMGKKDMSEVMIPVFSVSIFHSQQKNYAINTLRLRQNGRHFPDNIFTHIFLNENV